MADADADVRFPGQPTDAAGDDLSAPIVELLRDLNMLPSQGDLDKADGFGAVFKGPPQSVAVIEGGASALSKWWAAAFAGTAALSGAVAAVGGFWSEQREPVRVALVAGAAFLAAALVIGIAILLSTDVRARGNAATQQLRERAAVARTFLALSQATSAGGSDPLRHSLIVAAALNQRLQVKLTGGSGSQPVAGVRFQPEENLQLKVGDDWVSTGRIESFTTG